MSLINCYECGRTISDKSSSCPHCGAPLTKATVCSECGKQVPVGAAECPNCGCPVESPSQPEIANAANNGGCLFSILSGYRPPKDTQPGDNEAESVLYGCARWVWWVTIITMGLWGVVALIMSFVALSGVGDAPSAVGSLGIIGGIIILILAPIVARINWSLIMIVVNISTNIRSIKHSLQK